VTDLQIDTVSARQVASTLRATTSGIDDVRLTIARIATVAGFVHEHLAASSAAGEASEEVGLIARVLALTADRADEADSTYAAMLDQWAGAALATLRNSINDGRGTSVRALISSDPLALLRGDVPASLSVDAARDWWASLPEHTQVVIAAEHADRFDGTAVGAAIIQWIDGLDGEALRELYEHRAFANADIDPAEWIPELGLDHNRAIVEAVYEYYGELYREHPDRLWWSGMAALIGPSFYGGFQDLETFSDLLDAVSAVAGSPIGGTVPGAIVVDLSGPELSEELRWYQQQLLQMQHEIFLDMAPVHEAYLAGGIEHVERMLHDDPYGYGQQTIGAWRQIDTGWRTDDPDLIAAGNRQLLLREQRYVIDNDYNTMRQRPLTGEAVTYGMTLIGAPSVPGARTYPEVFPLEVEVGATVSTPDRLPLLVTPFGGVSVDVPQIEVGAGTTITTPLPDGNISVFWDRWDLIELDTLPVYVELARDHPEVILGELDRPVGERSDEFRIDERLDDIVRHLLLEWDVDVEVRIGVSR
jgi:hypothetical protein